MARETSSGNADVIASAVLSCSGRQLSKQYAPLPNPNNGHHGRRRGSTLENLDNTRPNGVPKLPLGSLLCPLHSCTDIVWPADSLMKDFLKDFKNYLKRPQHPRKNRVHLIRGAHPAAAKFHLHSCVQQTVPRGCSVTWEKLCILSALVVADSPQARHSTAWSFW